MSLIAFFAKTKGIAIGSDLYNTACKHAEGGGGIFSYDAKAAGRQEVSAREFAEKDWTERSEPTRKTNGEGETTRRVFGALTTQAEEIAEANDVSLATVF